ncbi:CHY zinc finger protein [Clavibacter sp. Sh2088]|uniref:CHY zinc finger protein n=1 Tax=Clavibacter sp. Sh2088 TaxID=3397676 RepID=UPI0039E1B94F
MDTVTSACSPATDDGVAGRDPAAEIDDVVVRGPSIDAETRCIHYGSALDVVALRAPCCDAWYPCHLCHAAVADHPLQVIPRAEHHLPAALCGVCRATMSVPEYLAADSCPSCGAAFNPGCAAHAHVYFAP